jgi:subtilisin family serine protease
MANSFNDLKMLGIGSVIVIPKKAGAGLSQTAVNQMASHFSSRETSQISGLASTMREAGRLLAPPQPMRYFANLGIVYGTVDPDGYKALVKQAGKDAEVSLVPALSIIRPVNTQAATAPKSSTTWGIRRPGVPALWKQGLTGKGVLVGHLDTGVDGKHATLKKAVEQFAEFDDLGEMVPNAKPHDTAEHGTHTAATIAGRAVNGVHVGVAYEAGLASAIVIEGGEVIARVLGGMDWSLGQGVRILSMSLGLRGWFNQFLPLTRLLRARGVLPVFAVGNEGPGTSRSPGNYPEALSVGACDRQNRVAEFSSSQRFARTKEPLVPDLVVPGVGVISAKPGGGYQSMDGSSMATPHVAGLAALLMQAKPLASIDQIEKAILGSCTRPPGISDLRGNRGIPDAAKALSLL